MLSATLRTQVRVEITGLHVCEQEEEEEEGAKEEAVDVCFSAFVETAHSAGGNYGK